MPVTPADTRAYLLATARQRETAARRRAEELRERLASVAPAIRSASGASAVIRFGSFARGQAHEGSDVDMAVCGASGATDGDVLRACATAFDYDVHLVHLEHAPPSPRARIEAEGIEF